MKPLRDRVMEKIEVASTGCWHWTGALSDKGYGRVRVGQSVRLAHRVTYELFVGPIPTGLELDHLCRVPRCVNPEHLEPVTGAENTQRGWDARPRKTRCIHDHEFTPDNTTFVGDGKGGKARACLTCQRAAKRRYKQRARAAA